jgi:hypothetical protein
MDNCLDDDTESDPAGCHSTPALVSSYSLSAATGGHLSSATTVSSTSMVPAAPGPIFQTSSGLLDMPTHLVTQHQRLYP